MKHRPNAHHSNDGINISSKRCVTSAAARRWGQDNILDGARSGDYAFAFVVMVAERIVADSSAPIRQGRLVKARLLPSLFSLAARLFICSPASKTGRYGGAPDVLRFW
jgi:hypothetical protein